MARIPYTRAVHGTHFVAVENLAWPAQVFRVALPSQPFDGGFGALAAPHSFLFRNRSKDGENGIAEPTATIEILLRVRTPRNSVPG